MVRDFDKWLSTFRTSIADYKYYIDFDKIYKKIDDLSEELKMMNSLLNSKDIEKDFELLLNKSPEILKCIPILLAVRNFKIPVLDEDGAFIFDFTKKVMSNEDYKMFMNKTGLFDLLINHRIHDLKDYVMGVEVGLDSNGRKNRGGHLMEDLVEDYLKKNSNIEYYKEMYLSKIEKEWGLDLSSISNTGKSEKRFDFVVKTSNCIYAIETNFYASGGSKLNETARSYKMIAEESKDIKGFKFVWFTDGAGWNTAKKNLQETFDVLETIYNISDLENGVMENLFI